ncbi:MAG: HAMP domain-containing sensor histidine kinase [Aquabacterium sp.]|nr:HAMP domain-containing sensor histidine kinase [Aquabacterium sp.]
MSPLQLTAMVAGVLYGMLAITLWVLLRRRHAAQPLSLWVIGALLAGVGLALLGAPEWLPGGLSPGLAFHCLMGAFVLRILALRHELGRPLQLARAGASWALAGAVHQLAPLLPPPGSQLALSAALLVVAALVFARHAAAAGRLLGARIGHGLAATECLLALAIALRTVAAVAGWAPADGNGGALDLALAVGLAVLTAVFGNLGYLGLVLGRSRAAERAAIAVQWAERLRREAAEDRAASLRDLLHQRDELAAERDQLLKLLAHEIRQPLHNASGALQAARAVLVEPRQDVLPMAAERLQRAQGVLADVRSVLDNTLAAANLLGGDDALCVPDTPLLPLIQLALGDLPETQRRLVRVHWQDLPDTAELEAGLVRLALRNLMRNAFTHGGPAVSVLVQCERQTKPPALVLSVVDDGVGPPPGWQPALQPGAQASPARTAGSRPAACGLGLFIVREVMARHGGSLSLQPRHPHGMVARMVFPQHAQAPATSPRTPRNPQWGLP